MKFEWKYRYVPEGQLEPDELNRWAIEGYIFVHIDNALPEYSEFKAFGEYIRIPVATIVQKGTLPSGVPSVIHNFCCSIPCFKDAANMGLSGNYNFFSNDIEELKLMVQEQFEKTARLFQNTL